MKEQFSSPLVDPRRGEFSLGPEKQFSLSIKPENEQVQNKTSNVLAKIEKKAASK